MTNVVRAESRYWCFTLNNHTTLEEGDLSRLVEDGGATYLIYGREGLEEGKTPHLQGYLEFSRKKRIAVVKRTVGNRAHLESRRGTGLEAAEYCKKEGDFVEYGEMSVPRQGRRKDLEEIKDLINGGAKDLEIANKYFGTWTHCYKSLGVYRGLLQPTRVGQVEVHCVWGPTGYGKTRIVHHLVGEDLGLVMDSTLQWFDGYMGERYVLIDDFRSVTQFAFLLKVLDRYRLKVPVKGNFINWFPEKIFITSAQAPPWGYGGSSFEDVGQLTRRFTSVTELDEPLDFEDESQIQVFRDLFNL